MHNTLCRPCLNSLLRIACKVIESQAPGAQGYHQEVHTITAWTLYAISQ